MTSFHSRKWLDRFLELAQLVATWSKDPSTKVGAVIVDTQRRVIATGYNGFPRGVRDTAERYAERELKYPLVVHAEANAILNAVANVAGATLVATMSPCAECAKLIIQSGIVRVVAPRLIVDRWADSHAHARTMFTEAGVTLIEIEPVVAERATQVTTIDDARAVFAPLLAPLEGAFPEYTKHVKVELGDSGGYGVAPAWALTLVYRGKRFMVLLRDDADFLGLTFHPHQQHALAYIAVTSWILAQLRAIEDAA